MDVAGLQPEPVHGRQMPDRIAALAVPHQLWFCGGAGGEIEQHRIVGPGLAVGREVGGCLVGRRDSTSSPAPPRRRRCACSRRARRRTSAVLSALVMTWRTRPRAKRSARSLRVSSVVAGTITAPSFIAASMHSHSGTTLPSISRMRSPRRTPRPRSALATRFERSLNWAKESLVSPPSSSTIHSAGRSLPRAIGSK